mmetsp:Transcript_2107/g.8212  ORF Transcript_2107/g.8212 Transcript_2107/m.8212 type:complete len:330 (-) Transcript_2107:890-1879(-)
MRSGGTYSYRSPPRRNLGAAGALASPPDADMDADVDADVETPSAPRVARLESSGVEISNGASSAIAAARASAALIANAPRGPTATRPATASSAPAAPPRSVGGASINADAPDVTASPRKWPPDSNTGWRSGAGSARAPTRQVTAGDLGVGGVGGDRPVFAFAFVPPPPRPSFLLRRSATRLDVLSTLSAVSGGRASASAAASSAMDVSNICLFRSPGFVRIATGLDLSSAPPSAPSAPASRDESPPGESPPGVIPAIGDGASDFRDSETFSSSSIRESPRCPRLSKLSLAFSGLGLGTGASASASGSSAGSSPESTRPSFIRGLPATCR